MTLPGTAGVGDDAMHNHLKILFVDDEPTDIELEQLELERQGLTFASRTAASEDELSHALLDFDPDIVLCDYTLRGFSGLRALATSRRLKPATPVVMVSGSIADDTALECLKSGATDYLLKANIRRLGSAVQRAVDAVRQRKEFEQRIDELAHYDTLTGLPNLAHIDELVRRSIGLGGSPRIPMAIAVLNLDRFRFIEEEYGRDLADDMLKDISVSLNARFPKPDCVARIGADEFLLVLRDIGEARQAGFIVEKLLSIVGRPRTLGTSQLKISASAGIALYPDDGERFETLLCNAGAALREAKLTPGSFRFHSADAAKRIRRRWQLEADLRSAIASNGLRLQYQPQFAMDSGAVCGVEALARWMRPDGQAVAPSLFIPMAEQSGMIGILGTWALKESCRTVAAWTGIGLPVPLCVNVSAHQICASFTEVISRALESSGLLAQHLELEITESVLVDDTDLVLKCLMQWKRLGVRIAVDDFGTGYSNLGYLSRLPIDRLKIDRSLIRDLRAQSKEVTIVAAIISLGRELGFTVLAEGVETEEQFALLNELGCHQAQGYLLSRPMTPSRARILMNRRWGMRATVHGAAVANS